MSAENNVDAQADLRNEVLRRVGRNLLLFQQIELLIKFLLENQNIETGPNGPLATQIERQKAIKKKTLGQLCGQYFEEMFSEAGGKKSEEPVTELRIRTSFHIELSDADELRRDQEKFAAILEERNELVHHFLTKYQLRNTASLQAALIHLEEQRERALPLHQSLSHMHGSLMEGRRDMAAYIQSPEGEAAINLMVLQSSRIVALLVQATNVLVRPDGWTLLSSAGHYISQAAPEQLPSIEPRFGHKNLRSLIAAAELFEVRDEAMSNGQKRSIYKLRPDVFELDKGA